MPTGNNITMLFI